MDPNKLLTPVALRIMGDATLKSLTTDPVRVVKGKNKGGKGNPCFTVDVLTAPIDEDFKAINGTIQVKIYLDDYASGNPNIETMGPVLERLMELFDDKPLTVSGYLNYSLWAQEPLGPLPETVAGNNTGEHFGVVRIGYGLIRN